MKLEDLTRKIELKQLNIAIVGFGYIGTCIGAVFAERGFRVIGIDPQKEIVDQINQGTTVVKEPGLKKLIRKTWEEKTLCATTDLSRINEVDVIIVTVGTPLDEFNRPDLSQIVSVSQEIKKYLKKDQLVIFKSTVPPHTTERIVKPILEESQGRGDPLLLAFCPERLAEGNALAEFQTIPVVVGGVNEESTKVASLFFSKALGVKTIELSSAQAAEMTKLADNLWIDLNIALANELAMLSDKLGLDVLEVIDAANSLPKVRGHVNILVPSMGVGGYCLTKDPWFVYQLGQERGLDLKTPVLSRTINEGMPRHTFDLIRQELNRQGKQLEQCKIAVLGVAFKSNTGDCRWTPTKLAIELLEKSGCELSICDPWVGPQEMEKITSKRTVATIEEAIRGADCVCFFAGHDEFKQFPIERIGQLAHEGAVIIDGRIFYSQEQIRKIREQGLCYKGIGR